MTFQFFEVPPTERKKSLRTRKTGKNDNVKFSTELENNKLNHDIQLLLLQTCFFDKICSESKFFFSLA